LILTSGGKREKQVVKLIRQKGCIAAARGRLDRIRQVAPTCIGNGQDDSPAEL